jgi:hypothetical protein
MDNTQLLDIHKYCIVNAPLTYLERHREACTWCPLNAIHIITTINNTYHMCRAHRDQVQDILGNLKRLAHAK